MKKFLLSAFTLFAASSVFADTVLLNETFNDNDYTKSFPYVMDGDGLNPNDKVSAFFLSATTGTYQPWWIIKDSDAATNIFFASHSCYSTPGQSNDWLISVPLEIPSEGFNLSFEAQSFTFDMDDEKLSDLSIFITEELIDPDNLPTTPTVVYEKIPQGATDVIEGEFTEYTYNLDAYVGKTIYINFVNQSYDKEILVIDNVKVYRIDKGRLTVSEVNEYTAEESFSIDATIESMTDDGLTNWELTYTDGVNTFTEKGETLAGRESKTFTFNVPVEVGTTANYTISFTADDMPATTSTGSVSRISYVPFRKMLIEDSTGTWCGYCPSAAYNIECMQEDEEMKEYVVAVSVHASGSPNDQMVVDYYHSALGCTTQPTLVLNRKDAFSMGTADLNFDKTNPASVAYRIAEKQKEPTLLDVDLTGDWVIEGNDTTAINCRAVVKTAFPTSESRYRLAFILTENNVYLPNNGNWKQSNYYSGAAAEIGSTLGGWTELPEYVINVRYQDVARGIWDFNGIEGSLPEALALDTEYNYDYQIVIPDTEKISTAGTKIRPAIKRDYCIIICAVIDTVTGEVVNVDSYPMSEVAENRFTTQDLVDEIAGIGSIEVDGNGEVVYYDMQGRRVVNPENGIYIRHQGGKAAKVVIR